MKEWIPWYAVRNMLSSEGVGMIGMNLDLMAFILETACQVVQQPQEKMEHM